MRLQPGCSAISNSITLTPQYQLLGPNAHFVTAIHLQKQTFTHPSERLDFITNQVKTINFKLFLIFLVTPLTLIPILLFVILVRTINSKGKTPECYCAMNPVEPGTSLDTSTNPIIPVTPFRFEPVYDCPPAPIPVRRFLPQPYRSPPRQPRTLPTFLPSIETSLNT